MSLGEQCAYCEHSLALVADGVIRQERILQGFGAANNELQSYCALRCWTLDNDRGTLDDQLLAVKHVDGELVFTTDLEDDADEPEATVADETRTTDLVIADGGEIPKTASADSEDERPDDCACVPTQDDLPCWPCWRAGFRTPNSDAGGEA